LIKQSPAGRTFGVIPYYEKAKAYLEREIGFKDIESDMNKKDFPRKYFGFFIQKKKQVVPRGYQIAAKSKNASVREAVASNPNCPEDLLRTLATDEDYYVCKGAASNSNCPEDLLRTLAKDEEADVRHAAAKNPNCPEDVLRTLAEDGDADVRKAAISNPNCPEDALRTLAKDGYYDVRQAAAYNLRKRGFGI
jgi:hypothetical protein